MKLRKFLFGIGMLASVLIVSCDKNDDDELNDVDKDFMLKASLSNSAEIDAANLASGKATNAAVKAFAQSMLAEHSTAQNDLKSLSAGVGFPVKDTIDPAHIAMKAQLSALSGRAFDSAYIHAQVADHSVAVTNFQNGVNNGRHSDVRNFAGSLLPHIQMHQQRADSIANAYFRR